MDLLTHPAVLIFLVSSLIGGIIWLVRLEGKGNSTEKDLAKFKADTLESIKDVEAELKDTRTRFFEHAANATVHHNAEAYNEFKVGLERRIMEMSGSLKDIIRKLDGWKDHQ